MTQACPPFLAVLGSRVAKRHLIWLISLPIEHPASLSHGPNYHSLGLSLSLTLSLSHSVTLLDCFTVPLSLLLVASYPRAQHSPRANDVRSKVVKGQCHFTSSLSGRYFMHQESIVHVDIVHVATCRSLSFAPLITASILFTLILQC